LKQRVIAFLVRVLFFIVAVVIPTGSAISQTSLEYYEEWLQRAPLLYHGTREDFIEQSLELARSLENFYDLASVYDLNIPKDETVKRIEGEYYTAGKFFDLGMEFPELEEGKTIYILYLDKGDFRLIYSPEIPDMNIKPDAEEILVTHRSLEARLSESGYDAVICSGEINIVNGRMNEINNRSNTFKGEEKHLFSALMFFRQAGLKIENRTRLVDFSDLVNQAQLPHLKSLDRAKILLEVKDMQSYKKFNEAYQLLYSRYPNPDYLGWVDAIKLIRMNDTGAVGLEMIGIVNDMNREGVAVSFKKLAVEGRGDDLKGFIEYAYKHSSIEEKLPTINEHMGYDDQEMRLKDLYRYREILRGELLKYPDNQELVKKAEKIDKEISSVENTYIFQDGGSMSVVFARLGLAPDSTYEEVNKKIIDLLGQYFGVPVEKLTIEQLNIIGDIYKYISYRVGYTQLPVDVRAEYTKYSDMISIWSSNNQNNSREVKVLHMNVVKNPIWKAEIIRPAMKGGSGNLRIR
jgi:hypothetical protein